MNLVQMLEESARKFGFRKYLISSGGSLSFRGLNERVGRLSRGLKEGLNIGRGDKVAILLNNSLFIFLLELSKNHPHLLK